MRKVGRRSVHRAWGWTNHWRSRGDDGSSEPRRCLNHAIRGPIRVLRSSGAAQRRLTVPWNGGTTKSRISILRLPASFRGSLLSIVDVVSLKPLRRWNIVPVLPPRETRVPGLEISYHRAVRPDVSMMRSSISPHLSDIFGNGLDGRVRHLGVSCQSRKPELCGSGSAGWSRHLGRARVRES